MLSKSWETSPEKQKPPIWGMGIHANLNRGTIISLMSGRCSLVATSAWGKGYGKRLCRRSWFCTTWMWWWDVQLVHGSREMMATYCNHNPVMILCSSSLHGRDILIFSIVASWDTIRHASREAKRNREPTSDKAMERAFTGPWRLDDFGHFRADSGGIAIPCVICVMIQWWSTLEMGWNGEKRKVVSQACKKVQGYQSCSYPCISFSWRVVSDVSLMNKTLF